MNPDPASPRRPGRARLFLAISLGLNLALVGLVAGLLLNGPGDTRRAVPPHLHYALSLPAPYRQDLRQSLRASRDDWEGARARLQDRRAAFATALVADPFDLQGVADVLAQEDDLARALSERGAGVLLAQIARMSPEDRAAYAENVLEKSRENRR
jgi:uncharacterized membrane protein